MIKTIFDFLQFLLSCAPLLTSVAVFTLLSVWLAKSIKKHPKTCYTILSLPFLLVAVPTVLRWCGVEATGFTGVPVLGHILRDYIHMGTLGHPLLIIIMYMGALDPKIPFVKKLMSIRKELSIISGFPVLTHSLIRVANNFPSSLRFFFDNEGYMTANRVSSELGAGISSFSFVLGVVMLAIFLPLWITSFDSVHKRMGGLRWKKLQKWSYVLYATLFIHAVGIQVGGILNPRGGNPPRVAVEAAAASGQEQTGRRAENPGQLSDSVRAGRPAQEPSGNPLPGAPEGRGENGRVSGQPANETQQAAPAASQGRRLAKGFTDFQIPPKARQCIHLISLVLVYGSYLFLRVRKAKKKKQKS